MKRAEVEVIWLLQEADGDACGLRAVAWNHLAELDERERRELALVGGGPKRAGYVAKDYYPDNESGARGRLVRDHRAWVVLPAWAQAVLQARYLPRGPHVPVVHGLGEWTWVAQLLTSIRSRAARERTTPFAVLQVAVAKAKDDTLRRNCEALVNEALELYGDALIAGDEERERTKARQLASWLGEAA